MTFWDYIKCFPFKNFFAFPLTGGLFYLMATFPNLHDSCIVLLTLVVKYFYDTSMGTTAKDVAISKALDNAQNTPGTPNEQK